MNDKLSRSKIVAIGAISGIIGAIIGLIPVIYLRSLLISFLELFRDSIPWEIYMLADGIELWFPVFLIVFPVSAALMGIIGVVIGSKKHSTRLWLWGGIAGSLINLFFGNIGSM